MHLAVAYLANSDPLNVSGIETFEGSILAIVVLAVAIKCATLALKSMFFGVMTAVCIVAVAAMVYGMATSGSFLQVGTDLMHMVLTV